MLTIYTGILLIFLFLSLITNRIFSKLSANTLMGKGNGGYALYLVVVGIVSCIFFLVSAGFQLQFRIGTIVYAAVYAAVVFLSMIVSLVLYNLADISNVIVTKNACVLMVTSLMGCLFFHEQLTWINILRILIMLSAIFLVFADIKRSLPAAAEKAKRRRNHLSKLPLVLALVVFCNSVSIVLMKSYALADNVTDNNSFYFLTNAFVGAGAFLWLIIERIRTPCAKREKPFLLKPKHMLFFIGNTVSSNASALAGILLIAVMDVSVYTPISSALDILCGVAVSLVFREHLGKCSVLAALMAIVAVII